MKNREGDRFEGLLAHIGLGLLTAAAVLIPTALGFVVVGFSGLGIDKVDPTVDDLTQLAESVARASWLAAVTLVTLSIGIIVGSLSRWRGWRRWVAAWALLALVVAGWSLRLSVEAVRLAEQIGEKTEESR